MTHMPHTLRLAVVSGVSEHAARDRDSLLRMNFQDIQMFDTASELLDFASRLHVDLILMDGTVPDMQPPHFIRLIKTNTRLRQIPVIMVTIENRREFVLDAIGAGCAGYVLRPYSIATFERHLKLAWSSTRIGELERDQLESAGKLLSQRKFSEAASEFREIVADPDDSLRLFDMGTRHLLDQKFGKAISCFNQAVSQNAMFAEAYRGLAYAYQGLGDEESHAAYLKKAADAFAFHDRLTETKEMFVEILKTEPEAQNPYNSLGVELRRKGDLHGAMHAYEQALLLTPGDEVVHYNVAKALYLLGDLTQCGVYARQALALNPDFHEAAELCAVAATETPPPASVPEPRPKPGEPGAARLDLDE